MENKQDYVFTKIDHVIIANTPTDRYKLAICNKDGVFAVRLEEEGLNCPFCRVEGINLDQEQYQETLNYFSKKIA